MVRWTAGPSVAAYLADHVTPLTHGPPVGIDDYLAVVSAVLQRILPGDFASWSGVDLSTGTIAVGTFPQQRWSNAELAQRLASVVDDHPVAHSYLADLTDTSPRRISDVASRAEFRRTRAYADLYRPLGVDAQLTIVTRAGTTGDLHGWAINRSGHDFTDEEVATATAFQTTLAALERVVFTRGVRAPAPEAPAAPAPGARAPRPTGAPAPSAGHDLTPRELEVLAALSTGLTADAIGRVLRISAATVRKHLEHTYIKLDCHDRMLVVKKAAALRLLPVR